MPKRFNQEQIDDLKSFINSDKVQEALNQLPKHKRISFLIKAYEDISGIKMCYGTVKRVITSSPVIVKVGEREYKYA